MKWVTRPSGREREYAIETKRERVREREIDREREYIKKRRKAERKAERWRGEIEGVEWTEGGRGRTLFVEEAEIIA